MGQSKTRIGSPMDDTACAVALVGKEGLEPSRLAAHDPKSCSSASSDTSPTDTCYTTDYTLFAPAVHTSARGFRLIDRHGRHAHIANPLPTILPIHIASLPHSHHSRTHSRHSHTHHAVHESHLRHSHTHHAVHAPTTPFPHTRTSFRLLGPNGTGNPSRHSRVGGNLALHLRRASIRNTPKPPCAV